MTSRTPHWHGTPPVFEFPRAAACLASVVPTVLAVADPGAALAFLRLFGTLPSPEAELAELMGTDMTLRKHWSKELITVDGKWRIRYAACTWTGFTHGARDGRAAIRGAREASTCDPGDCDIVSLGAYETQVVDGPTGLYFRDRVPVLDREDADITRNLVYVVARPDETADELVARLRTAIEGPGQVSNKVRAVARPSIVDRARELLAAFIRRNRAP